MDSRAALSERLRTIPRLARNGSYQRAVEFKEFLRKALAALNKRTTSDERLRELINQYDQFNQ